MADRKEINDRRWGAIASIGVHLALLLLFFFMLAWREPNPPLPQYGIELNFGLDAGGSGEIQPTTQPAQSDPVAEVEPETNEPKAAQESESETLDSEPIEQEVDPTNPETLEDVEPIESPDVNSAEEEQDAKSEATETTQSSDEPVSAQNEQETISTSSEESDSETPDQAAKSNQGDQLEEAGDQGDPEGTLDARALYGNPGGGDGAALKLTGWVWDFMPRPRDLSQENGRIVFEITIDDQGDLISVRTLEKTVSPNIEKIYKAEVEKLTFSPTTKNTLPAPRSTGTITFIIRSR